MPDRISKSKARKCNIFCMLDRISKFDAKKYNTYTVC